MTHPSDLIVDAARGESLGPASSAINWRRTMTLGERQSLLRGKQGRVNAPRASDDVVEQWRSELSLTDAGDYERWLERHDWSDDVFRALVAPPVDAPACLDSVVSAHASAYAPANEPSSQRSLFSGLDVRARVFLTLAEPAARRAVETLARTMSEISNQQTLFDPATVHELFLPSLAPLLLMRMNRALTLQLHVARLNDQLVGETPEARFESFASLLRRTDYANSVFAEYPLLARQIVETVADWTTNTTEFLRRLCGDWSNIERCLAGGQNPGRLVSIRGDGDPHRRGRTVKIAAFESGFRIVYKPRSMEVDRHFNELLAWINTEGFEPAFHVPAILSRDGYGWSEFVESAPCASADEVERFYARDGGLLALLYALEATDMHMENLIAMGEHPVLVDIEALFHPRPKLDERRPGGRALAFERLQHTVLRIGLLPQRGGDASPQARFDGSGLSGGAEQLTPTPILSPERAGTDEMRYVRQHLTISPSKNRALLNGRATDAYEFREAIVRGFSSAYELIRRGRAALTGANGLLTRFANDEIRVVLRSTRTYGRVLQEACHPSLLGDAADQERLLERLSATLANRPWLARVIHAEIADLQTGNIPIFTSRPNSRDLWTSSGERIADFFDRPSLENSVRRVDAFDAGDLAREVWIINASLTTLAIDRHGSSERIVVSSPRQEARQRSTSPDRHAQPSELIGAAAKLGRRIEEMAIREDGYTSWLGVRLAGEKFWVLDPVTLELFSGTSGIALFLGYLAQASGEVSHKELALALAREARTEILRSSADTTAATIGPFANGVSGWIYTLAHLGQIFRDDSLLDTAHELRPRVIESVEADQTLDIIGGAAGLIGSLAALHACAPTRDLTRDVARCADHLVQRAERMPAGGFAWNTNMPSSAPLTGFSHGASGIAWALLKAASLTGNERYVDVARAGFDYERAVFLPNARNWPDFRAEPGAPADPDPTPMRTWCHGAPGIGLTRIEALAQLDDASIRSDIDSALHTTLSQGFGPGDSHCLCHGSLGNLETLVRAGRLLGRPDLLEHAAAVGSLVLDDIRNGVLRCGTPAHLEVPGLMTGLSGIGLGLLRLADPEHVPSVLTLDAPPVSSRSNAVAPPTLNSGEYHVEGRDRPYVEEYESVR